MNKVDLNSSSVSFGIAFRKYTNKQGIVTADLLDLKDEIAMYKKIDNKLKTDKFIKTELGLQSSDAKIEKADCATRKSLRYIDNDGEFYLEDQGYKLQNVSEMFQKVRLNFDKLFNKK